MKKYIILIILLQLLSCTQSKFPDGDSIYESYAPDGIPFVVSDTLWTADMRGNQRAVVHVETPSEAVIAELPWRRSDMRPETKKIVVVDATTNHEIKNVSVRLLTSEKGIIEFQPATTPGDYYIYYMPYKYRKGWDDARYGKPWNDYLVPEYNEADNNWVIGLADAKHHPKASVIRFESRSEFDFFTSMGSIATKEEMDKISNAHPENPIVFTEDRAYPIRLTNELSTRWIQKGASTQFEGEALRNEYYVWQIGVWAAKNDIKNVRLQFNDFTHSNKKDIIKKENITCFNQEGTNWNGTPVTFNVNVQKSKVQALWCGVQIPEEATPGKYESEALLTADGIEPQKINIKINVKKETLADKGDGDLWRHARLRWLNSTIGMNDLPVNPYSTMTVNGKEISATGKTLEISDNGLPISISINDVQILSEPMQFAIETNSGTLYYKADKVNIEQTADGLVKWESKSTQNDITIKCSGYMEYDGYIHYDLKVSSNKNILVNDIKLLTGYSKQASEYFMGIGYGGGYRPSNLKWNWEGPWDSYWIGCVKAGLHVEFRGSSYNGPLINDYKPEPSKVWSNSGKGEVLVSGNKGDKSKVMARTGKDTITSKDKNFEFALLITPVKTLNPSKHFSERYYHADHNGFDKAAEEGANIANIHHARPLNPVINYPFIVRDSLIQFIKHEHTYGRKVKIYYTIRELSNHTKEIYALKSLNHEIFVSGVGYGLPWQCEHLIDDYKPAWYTELPNETSDAALVLNGFSRWINYYLEGLRWMFENYDLDGIYMDDVSFDRNVMKRMRKIISKYHPSALIDLHSNTGYSIGPANQYTDFFPYVDRLWFGESFRYNKMSPDEWLITFSGIPFGQMSEMLQDGGNRYLGMVYGATARHSYGKFSPAPVWKLWKSFGIEGSKMSGYWDDDCPVKTNNTNVKATAYIKSDKVLISIGNFDNQDQVVRLSINWEQLNMNPTNSVLKAEQIENFQEATTFNPQDAIKVKSKEGWLLILSAK